MKYTDKKSVKRKIKKKIKIIIIVYHKTPRSALNLNEEKKKMISPVQWFIYANIAYLSNFRYRANPGTYWYYVIWRNLFLCFFRLRTTFLLEISDLRLLTLRVVVQEETLSISLNVLIGMDIFGFLSTIYYESS